MRHQIRLIGGFLLLLFPLLAASAQQIGKYIPVNAGSDADHMLRQINAATDPAQKLALIDKFAAGPGQGEMALIADDLYVNYYLSQKNYDKVFEYGDKLFSLDPDNFNNAVNMVRAAGEKGDVEKLLAYGEKAGAILHRYEASPAPAGVSADAWQDQKKQTLESNRDGITYVADTVYNGIYSTPDPAERATRLMRFAKSFPDSPYANVAMGLAATSYQQAQNVPKMLETANELLTKDPNNLGMLLLLSDYYSEKGEHLDKAEQYAKKAASLADLAKKPDGVSGEQWKRETALQKGLALSALGQINLQKKGNAAAVENLLAAAPLLKSDDASYGRNQYRLGFAYVNLKKMAQAKEAFAEAASVKGPYQVPAAEKLKSLGGTRTRRRRKTS